MIDDLTKEQIEQYFMGELSEEDSKNLMTRIDSSSELKEYFSESEKLWNVLSKAETIEPHGDYIQNFWNNVSKDEERKEKRFSIFNFINIKWGFVGSLAVFLLLSTIIINNFVLEEEKSGFVFEADDELLINDLEDALSKNTHESLKIFGPWDDLEN